MHCDSKDGLSYDNIFSSKDGRQSKASTVDSGITAGKSLCDDFSNTQECMLTKEIIERTKPKFLNSTSNTSDGNISIQNVTKGREIEEIRRLLPENYINSFFQSTEDDAHRSLETGVQDKFVINLFECRESFRTRKRNSLKWPEIKKIEIINDPTENVSDVEDGQFATAKVCHSVVSINIKTTC